MYKLNQIQLALCLLLISFGTLANTKLTQDSFEVGKEYVITSPEVKTEPILEEFFNYACGACYSMEGFITDFKANHPGLTVKAIPVELNPAWRIYVKAYYIGEHLNVLDKSHGKLFHRIHVEKKHLKNDQEMKEFFVALGVTEKSYDEVANSYWLNTQMKLAKEYAKKHRVIGTPLFLVNKRFKLDNKQLGSMERVTQAIEVFSGVGSTESETK